MSVIFFTKHVTPLKFMFFFEHSPYLRNQGVVTNITGIRRVIMCYQTLLSKPSKKHTHTLRAWILHILHTEVFGPILDQAKIIPSGFPQILKLLGSCKLSGTLFGAQMFHEVMSWSPASKQGATWATKNKKKLLLHSIWHLFVSKSCLKLTLFRSYSNIHIP